MLQRNLSVSYNNLARDLRANGQPMLALPPHRTALAIAERLWRADTASMEHLQDVAFSEDVYAEALADARAWPEALAMYARAITSKQRLQQAEPRTRGTPMIWRFCMPDEGRHWSPPTRSPQRTVRTGVPYRWPKPP